MGENLLPATVDEYISGFPEELREKLTRIRETIRKAAPEAHETIKYGMPTYVLNGNLVYFAVSKKHIGIYPAPSGDEAFNQRLAPYKAEKSTVQLPINQPIPYDLIADIVALRIKDNREKVEARANKKK